MKVARLIGRADELAALDSMVEGGARLISVIGPPGIGKTALAKTYLERRRDRASAPGYFVDLTEAATEEDLVVAVSRTLDLAPASQRLDRGAAAALGERLSQLGPHLLVLDNFEQLPSAAADAVAAWLARAPQSRLLVTSRALLHAPGERAVELGPLAVPAPGSTASDAVDLFLEAVRLTSHAYQPTAAEQRAIADITRRLDGIPLAIELAASRCRVLGPAALLSRLEASFSVLGRSRAGSDRERTLEGAILWSWSLLDPVERDALAQCSVFRGGFDVAAAESVLDLVDDNAVIDVLQALRDKSLLVASRTETGDLRLGLYLSVRAFAAARLADSGRSSAAFARHARHYARAQGTLPIDQDNVLLAAERALAVALDDPAWSGEAPGLALAALASVASAIGRWQSNEPGGRGGDPRPLLDLLDRALERGSEAPAALRAEALRVRARLRMHQGATREARDDGRTATALAAASGDPRLHAKTLVELGNSLAYLAEFDEALVHLEAARRLYGEIGESAAEAMALVRASHCDIEMCRPAAARVLLARARELYARTTPEPPPTLDFFEGVLEQDGGALDQALDRYQRTFAWAGRHADRMYEGASLVTMGVVRQEQGRLSEAIDLLERGRVAIADLDNRFLVIALGHLGGCLAMTGRLAEAALRLDDGERLFPVMDLDGLQHAVLLQRGLYEVALARSASAAGDEDRARGLLRAATARVERVRQTGPDGIPLAARSVDVRISLRMLERALAGPSAPDAGRTELLVHASGDWFELAGGQRVSCKGRSALRSILLALARHRLDAPGEPLSRARLVAEAWPGEKLVGGSGRNRLNVALSGLRSLGLRAALVATDDGYLLDPSLAVRLVG